MVSENIDTPGAAKWTGRLYLVAAAIALVALALYLYDWLIEQDGGDSWIDAFIPLAILILMVGLYVRERRKAG